MKDVITSREELFLAKVAGRDVDIKTMTPSVASNMTEKLMLELAERIDDLEEGGGESGGGAEKFVIHATLDTSDEPTLTDFDKTFSEVAAAIAANKVVVIYGETEGDVDKVALEIPFAMQHERTYLFCGVTMAGDPQDQAGIVLVSVDAGENDAIESTMYLHVVGGSSPSEAEICILHGTLDATQGTFAVTSSASDVIAAAESGKPIMLKYNTLINGASIPSYATAYVVAYVNGEGLITANIVTDVLKGKVEMLCIELAISSDTVIPSVSHATLTEIPPFDASTDVGATLKVGASGLEWST